MTNPQFLDALSAWSTAVTAILTLGLLGAASWAAFVGVATLKASQSASEAAERANEQAKFDSIERTRPYVFVEIIPGLASPKSYDVRITNSGQSAARELTLGFSDWPEELDETSTAVKALFQTPRTLPPGCSIRSFWRLEGVLSDPDKGVQDEGLGTHGTISVSYTSADPSAPSYRDDFDVMIDNSGLWPQPWRGPNPPAKMGCGAKAFYKLGQALVQQIGENAR